MRLNHPVDTNNWVVCSEKLWGANPSYEHSSVAGLVFAKCSDGRFQQDRCMERAGNFFVLLDGVLLNKVDLLERYAVDTVAELIVTLVESIGYRAMLNELRGPFEGCILDIERNNLTVFVNQTGDTAAYVYRQAGDLVISNSFDLIQRLLVAQGIATSFDERAAQMMLSYGFMTDDSTFAQEVKRVLPGHYLTIDLGEDHAAALTQYWHLKYEPNPDLTLEQSVDLMQEAFMSAAQRMFDKDAEYGYTNHLIDISGGMDSRVVNLAAKKLGQGEITNVTYSETGTQEAATAIDVSMSMGNELLYYPLDGGKSALDPELNLRLNSGASLYTGITGGRPVLEKLNFQYFGLEHTGQVGDAVFGTYASTPTPRAPDESIGRYSLLHEHSGLVDPERFENEEVMAMNVRCFLGTNSSHLLRRHYTYAVSPFLDVDLLDAAFTIPLSQRYSHLAYEAWLEKYYPEALSLPSTRKLASEKEADAAKANRSMLARYWYWGLFRLKRDFGGIVGRPAERKLAEYQARPGYWYDTNEAYRRLLDGKEEAVATMDVSPSLKEDLMKSFHAKRVGYRIIDKTLAATVVTMYQLYFS